MQQCCLIRSSGMDQPLNVTMMRIKDIWVSINLKSCAVIRVFFRN